MNDQDQDKLNQLSTRIDAAKSENEHIEPRPDTPNEDTGQGRNVGYDLLGTVLGATLVGWLVDRSFHTSPWGLVSLIMLGFVVAIFQVWRSLNKPDKT